MFGGLSWRGLPGGIVHVGVWGRDTAQQEPPEGRRDPITPHTPQHRAGEGSKALTRQQGGCWAWGVLGGVHCPSLAPLLPRPAGSSARLPSPRPNGPGVGQGVSSGGVPTLGLGGDPQAGSRLTGYPWSRAWVQEVPSRAGSGLRGYPWDRVCTQGVPLGQGPASKGTPGAGSELRGCLQSGPRGYPWDRIRVQGEPLEQSPGSRDILGQSPNSGVPLGQTLGSGGTSGTECGLRGCSLGQSPDSESDLRGRGYPQGRVQIQDVPLGQVQGSVGAPGAESGLSGYPQGRVQLQGVPQGRVQAQGVPLKQGLGSRGTHGAGSGLRGYPRGRAQAQWMSPWRTTSVSLCPSHD